MQSNRPYILYHPAGAFLIAFGLFIGLVAYGLLFDPKTHKIYYLSLDGGSTHKQNNLTLVVDNNENNSQLIHMYGLPGPKPNVDTTDFTYRMGKIIDGNVISHTLSKKDSPFIVDTESGSFSGWLIVNNDRQSFSIPDTLETKPMVNIAILWILVGVISAFGFWEIYRHYDLETAKQINEKMSKNPSFGPSPSLSIKVEKLSNRYKTNHSKIRIAILQIGSIAFGVVAGFVALLNNGYVTNIRSITFEDTVVLFALGLAIGSVKEIVERI